MNAVIYYSNTYQSKRLAEYFAEITSFELFDIFDLPKYAFDTAILVFPVHCQNIPYPVKDFLACLRAERLIAIATYGKMCCGNVLNELQRRYRHNIIAAAYVPTKHTYLSESGFDDFSKLNVIVSKITTPSTINIPKIYKNPFSNFFTGLRSRMGVKIYKDPQCNNCGKCSAICNNKAIEKGKINRNCIRCLKCVENCPNKSLHFALRLPMRLYLQKKQQNDLIIYT